MRRNIPLSMRSKWRQNSAESYASALSPSILEFELFREFCSTDACHARSDLPVDETSSCAISSADSSALSPLSQTVFVLSASCFSTPKSSENAVCLFKADVSSMSPTASSFLGCYSTQHGETDTKSIDPVCSLFHTHMYMLTHTHTYMHTHTHTYMHTYANTPTCTHTHTFVHAYPHACQHTHTCAHTHTHTHTRTQLHVLTHVYICSYTYTHTHTHLRTRMHTFTLTYTRTHEHFCI